MPEITGLTGRPNWELICPITNQPCDIESCDDFFAITCEDLALSYASKIIDENDADTSRASKQALEIKEKILAGEKDDPLANDIVLAANGFKIEPHEYAGYIRELIKRNF